MLVMLPIAVTPHVMLTFVRVQMVLQPLLLDLVNLYVMYLVSIVPLVPMDILPMALIAHALLQPKRVPKLLQEASSIVHV